MIITNASHRGLGAVLSTDRGTIVEPHVNKEKNYSTNEKVKRVLSNSPGSLLPPEVGVTLKFWTMLSSSTSKIGVLNECSQISIHGLVSANPKEALL